MSRYWERAAQRAEREGGNVKAEAEGSKERSEQRAQEHKDEARPDDSDARREAGDRSTSEYRR